MRKRTSAERIEPGTVPAQPPVRANGSLYRMIRRLIVFILGMSVLLVGIVMIVAPGPAFVVIPLGLAILATEFVWARTILHRLKDRLVNSTGDPPDSRWQRFVAWGRNMIGQHKSAGNPPVVHPDSSAGRMSPAVRVSMESPSSADPDAEKAVIHCQPDQREQEREPQAL